MSCVVLVPCFKETLSAEERLSLAQCRRILGRYDIRIICPEGLLLPPECEGLKSEPFPASAFVSIDAYSRLLLSGEFYARFREWEHSLIYQLDAFVFRDELDDWCARGYDYIGAPWGSRDVLRHRHVREARPRVAQWPGLARLWYRRDFRVGNGGLSLRRIRSFCRVLETHGKFAAQWPGNEDLFWALFAPRNFRIPCENEAMYFALELEPSRYVARMNGRLPFGCHAWEKYEPDFWAAHIPATCGGSA